MLEDRPIVQRSLIGFGAFSFVFAAAMAGTAFMISGGFGLGGDERPRPHSVRDYTNATETAWTDWTQSAYAATPENAPAPAERAETPDAYEPASYVSSDQLDGAAPAERAERIAVRSEADILRDIERELAAYESQSAPSAAPNEAPLRAPLRAPDLSETDIVAAKQRAAAAMDGYGPY